MSNPPRDPNNGSIIITQAEIAEIFAAMENLLDTEGEFDWESNGYSNFDDDTPRACRHEWIETQLLTRTVYDCKHCGAQRENLPPPPPKGDR